MEKVLIYGKGISGIGAVESLKLRGVSAVVCDDEDFETLKNDEFTLVVVSPGIDFNHEVYKWASEKEIPAISELELGYLLCKKSIIAVTGTNGKTTTVEMLGKMFSEMNAKVTGNIGSSFSLAVTKDEGDLFVVEASSFQLEKTSSFRPHVAVITNITPDHIDRHGDMENYVKAKLKIARNQTRGDYLVLSADDIEVGYLDNFQPQSTVLYTSTRKRVRGAYLLNDKVWYMDEPICSVNRIKASGLHNISNALSAIVVAKIYGRSNDKIVRSLCEYAPTKHRLSYVGSIRGVAFYNDSKGTNVAATVNAMKSMPSSFCLILGGKDKGYDFDEIFKNATANLKKIFAIGETADKILTCARRYNFNLIDKCDNLDKAVIEAYYEKSDAVLLSPASSSFDMFKNYEERGERFEEIVKGLKSVEERR